MLGLEQGQGFTAEDAADFKGYAARLQEQMELYRETITDDEDKVEYAAFEKLHEDYHRILVGRDSSCTNATRTPKPSRCSTKS